MDQDELPFYTHDINEANLVDLHREIADLEAHRGRLVGVVSEEDGGIIAYAIGEDHAATITNALNR